jgi:hypothetical protein
MHAPALGFVCGGGTEGDDSRLRRCGVGGGCGEVVTCLPTCSSISTTTTSPAWLLHCAPYPLHWSSPSPPGGWGLRECGYLASRVGSYIKGSIHTHTHISVLLYTSGARVPTIPGSLLLLLYCYQLYTYPKPYTPHTPWRRGYFRRPPRSTGVASTYYKPPRSTYMYAAW